MATTTTRLSLPRPVGTDAVSLANQQALIDAIDANAAKKGDLDTHSSDTTKHVTAGERTTWNGKQDALGYTPVNSADVVTTAAANKILKLDANGKLPASITGDAATVGGILFRNNAGSLETSFDGGSTWKGAGGVKSVQRGLTTMSASGTVNVPINSINTSKSFVNISVTGTMTEGIGDSTVKAAPDVRAQLTSATNLELYLAGMATVTAYVSWEVVEYA